MKKETRISLKRAIVVTVFVLGCSSMLIIAASAFVGVLDSFAKASSQTAPDRYMGVIIEFVRTSVGLTLLATLSTLAMIIVVISGKTKRIEEIILNSRFAKVIDDFDMELSRLFHKS